MKREPHNLARALGAAAMLPRTDALYLAAEYRFARIRERHGEDAEAIGDALGVSVRQVQRLRAVFGVARPRGG